MADINTQQKYIDLFNWLKQCPELSELWAVMGAQFGDIQNKVIQLNGGSTLFEVSAKEFNDGSVKYTKEPINPYYEDYRIACNYLLYDDANIPYEVSNNIPNMADAEKVVWWINNQDEQGNLPTLQGLDPVFIVTQSPLWLAQTYQTESGQFMVDYWVNIRVYYKNPYESRAVIM